MFHRRSATPSHAPADDDPMLGVIGTREETPQAWLACGRSLSAVMLRGLAIGVRSSFLNNLVEVPGLREKLAETVNGGPYPQAVFRMGFPARQPGLETKPGLEGEQQL
jgi:hypothetical protein